MVDAVKMNGNALGTYAAGSDMRFRRMQIALDCNKAALTVRKFHMTLELWRIEDQSL